MIENLSEFLDGSVGEASYTRKVSLISDLKTDVGFVRIWLPRLAKNGGWISLVQVSWIHGKSYSIASGDDEVEALLSAFYMIRSFIEHSGFEVIFNNRKFGGFPLWPNQMLKDDSKDKVIKLIKKFENIELGFRWKID